MNLLQFSGKAETLLKLQGELQFASLLPQLHFSLKEWLDAGSQWEKLGLQDEWLSETLIVRSSASTEDQQLHSGAGQFLSVTDVNGSVAIQEAIQLVIESFRDDKSDHQILIQPMVRNIRVSGVAFSYEPGQPGPYYVINYDEDSHSSHRVTQGLSSQLKLVYISKSANPGFCGWKRQLLETLKELECLFGNDAIDVEFVVTSNDELILLQVRPLVLANEKLLTEHKHKNVLDDLKQRFRLASLGSDRCLGKTNLLGVMPDWNPAEIIGLRPNPLAYSLYQYLVTEKVWALQRYRYGYRDVRGVPLMLNLSGIPYIDVRASVNSFIPRQFPTRLAAQLVDFYLHRLRSHPQWHDKIEFKIVLASDHFGLQDDLGVLLDHGFSKQDCDLICTELRNLTRIIIDGNNGLWLKECKKVQQLPGLQKSIMDSALDDRAKLTDLLTLCREFGTGPFAGLARTAFVAMKFLRSLVSAGVISAEDQQRFMQSLSSLNAEMLTAASSFSWKQFLRDYGHIRPGMYDLLSPRYDEMPEENFSRKTRVQVERPTVFALNKMQIKQLEGLLVQHDYEYTAIGFMGFVRQAIEWREKAKYIYSQTLSEVLLLCQRLGQQYQLENEQLVFLQIEQIIQLTNAEEALKLVKTAQSRFRTTRSLILPPLITRESDIDYFQLQAGQPNFITLNQVTAHVVYLGQNSMTLAENLEGSIVVLTNADPGFDWLFTHSIAGLVTLYGGCNSHMAIRAAELNLPAVIGAGEVLFQQCVSAKLLSIDCEQQRVHRLQ
ncbi:MAG: phosphoenolpyruvate synthase [Gammaproteobacteria bacterium]|nr:phosphoenolpyruvate synthase [Gammaproteobacteria bacterium]